MRMDRVYDPKFSKTSSVHAILLQEVGCMADSDLKLHFKIYCDHLENILHKMCMN